MAKNRKKRYKKRNKPYPPLSRLDKGIYSFSLIVSVILVNGAIFGIFDIQDTFFYRNSDVLAFAPYGSAWALIPYGIMVTAILILLLSKLDSKRPIFGNKKIDYYNTTKYRFVLPIFDKRYIDRTLTKEKLVNVSIKIFVISFIFLCTCILSLNSLCHRYEFTQNEILKVNVKGEIVENFSYDEIEAYSVETPYHRVGNRGVGSYYLGFSVELPNGELVAPDTFSGLRDIEAFYKICQNLNNADKTVDADIERYIERHSLTREEKSMLREIFSQ